MDDGVAERVDAALGPVWSALRIAIDGWMAEHGERLRSRWQFPIGDDELLNHELGAFLHDPRDARPVSFDYDATPEHSYAFASTGVDGEHYSVLLDDQVLGVIVLTAPMAFDRPHVVVGETLAETLALASGGCGLAVPPNLAYRTTEQTIAALDEAGDNELWAHLRSELGVAPWPDPARRLAELEGRYLELVRPRRG